MRAYDIILKKRNGEKLREEELRFMVEGFLKGEVPDYQMSAFLMAVFFKHLDEEEAFSLTKVMMESGDKIDLSDVNGFKIDKHSSGGVGDKTTLVFAPLVSACGLKIAKMSGRSLGHTGGTIDKLESIPGFRTTLELNEFKDVVKEYGLAIVGQTANLAPADKKIYALRDATATVDEISLIASSIMSKKLAVGSDGLILDVKVGSGAFIKDLNDAEKLAKFMVEIGKKHGKKVRAIITDMNQPLGRMVGNSLEVLEAIETLKDSGSEDFTKLCVELSAHALEMAGMYSLEDAKKILHEKLRNGEALERFRKMVSAQGGDPRVVDEPTRILPISNEKLEVKAGKSGYISKMDTEKIGLAVMLLGAGRKRKDDTIDHGVGLEVLRKTGDRVEKGDSLVRMYVSEKSDIDGAKKLILEAYEISEDSNVEMPPLIYKVIR